MAPPSALEQGHCASVPASFVTVDITGWKGLKNFSQIAAALNFEHLRLKHAEYTSYSPVSGIGNVLI